MWLRFQETPRDLYASVGYAVVVAVALLALSISNPLAILLVLFVLGYVLVAAIFPNNTSLGWIDRIALSFGLSIGVVPLFGILLNLTPFGPSFRPVLFAVTFFTVGLGYAAYWRRMRLPIERRLSLTVELGLSKWKERGAVEKSFVVVLAASFVVACAALVYVVLTPRPAQTLTEFYVLGPGGNATGYPTNLSTNQLGSVILGVVNHEGAMLSYTIRVDLVGMRIAYNGTAGVNETAEVNRTTLSMLNFTISEGQNRSQPYMFRIKDIGLWKVQFILFRNGDFSNAYATVHIYVRVS